MFGYPNVCAICGWGGKVIYYATFSKNKGVRLK